MSIYAVEELTLATWQNHVAMFLTLMISSLYVLNSGDWETIPAHQRPHLWPVYWLAAAVGLRYHLVKDYQLRKLVLHTNYTAARLENHIKCNW